MGIMNIIKAVKKNDLVKLKEELDFFKIYIREDYDLNQVVSSKNGQSLLHIATRYGSDRVFLYLLEQGVNINIPDEQGNTPAHYAILYSQPRILEFLKKNGADFLRKNKCGRTLEQYIQVRPVKEESKRIKKELENIILETNQCRILSNNAQLCLRKETAENDRRQSEEEIVDTSDLALLTEVAMKQKEVYLNKTQMFPSSFFHNLPREVECQTEPLNLIKHDRALNLSVTSCFKN